MSDSLSPGGIEATLGLDPGPALSALTSVQTALSKTEQELRRLQGIMDSVGDLSGDVATNIAKLTREFADLALSEAQLSKAAGAEALAIEKLDKSFEKLAATRQKEQQQEDAAAAKRAEAIIKEIDLEEKLAAKRTAAATKANISGANFQLGAMTIQPGEQAADQAKIRESIQAQIEDSVAKSRMANAASGAAREQQHLNDVIRQGVRDSLQLTTADIQLAQAEVKAAAATQTHTAAQQKSAGSVGRTNTAIIQATYALDDMQYGFAAVANNIPVLAQSVASAVGEMKPQWEMAAQSVAAYGSVVIAASWAIIHHREAIKDLMGDLQNQAMGSANFTVKSDNTEAMKNELEKLEEQIKKVEKAGQKLSETEFLNYKGNKERAKELRKSLEEEKDFETVVSSKDKETRERAAGFKEAVGQGGGKEMANELFEKLHEGTRKERIDMVKKLMVAAGNGDEEAIRHIQNYLGDSKSGRAVQENSPEFKRAQKWQDDQEKDAKKSADNRKKEVQDQRSEDKRNREERKDAAAKLNPNIKAMAAQAALAIDQGADPEMARKHLADSLKGREASTERQRALTAMAENEVDGGMESITEHWGDKKGKIGDSTEEDRAREAWAKDRIPGHGVAHALEVYGDGKGDLAAQTGLSEEDAAQTAGDLLSDATKGTPLERARAEKKRRKQRAKDVADEADEGVGDHGALGEGAIAEGMLHGLSSDAVKKKIRQALADAGVEEGSLDEATDASFNKGSKSVQKKVDQADEAEEKEMESKFRRGVSSTISSTSDLTNRVQSGVNNKAEEVPKKLDALLQVMKESNEKVMKWKMG